MSTTTPHVLPVRQCNVLTLTGLQGSDPETAQCHAVAKASPYGLACTPKTSSAGCRLSSAHSEAWPCSRFVASAISPHVMSAPSPLQMYLPGRTAA